MLHASLRAGKYVAVSTQKCSGITSVWTWVDRPVSWASIICWLAYPMQHQNPVCSITASSCDLDVDSSGLATLCSVRRLLN